MIGIIQGYVQELLILISSLHIPFDESLRGNLPRVGGVYRVFEVECTWKESIYVGKTGNLHDRIHSNLLMGNAQAHILRRKLIRNAGLADEEAVNKYLKDDCRFQYLEMADENQRSLLKHFVVSVLKPRYND